MQCRNHPEETGVNTCNQCGCWTCEKCSFERGGRIFCPRCAAQQVSVAAGDSASAGDVGSAGDVAAYGPKTEHRDRRYVSFGLLFLFSVIIPIPGLNYMYMGFVKRGLVAMSAFFGTIYLTSIFASYGTWHLGILFAFAIPVLIFSCIFDGFRLRKRVNAGEDITDNIDDITAFIRRNKVVLTGFLLLIIAINVFGGILFRILNLLPVLIIIWVVVVLLKKPK